MPVLGSRFTLAIGNVIEPLLEFLHAEPLEHSDQSFQHHIWPCGALAFLFRAVVWDSQSLLQSLFSHSLISSRLMHFIIRTFICVFSLRELYLFSPGQAALWRLCLCRHGCYLRYFSDFVHFSIVNKVWTKSSIDKFSLITDHNSRLIRKRWGMLWCFIHLLLVVNHLWSCKTVLYTLSIVSLLLVSPNWNFLGPHLMFGIVVSGRHPSIVISGWLSAYKLTEMIKRHVRIASCHVLVV